MKRYLLKFSLTIFVLLTVSTFCQAQRPPIVGGYRETSKTDEAVIAAANFAVEAQTQKNASLKLVEIKRAARQIVAGSNYEMCLAVTEENKPEEATAVVYQDLQNNFSLTSWTSGKCAAGAAEEGNARTQTPAFDEYVVKVESIKNIRVDLKSHKYANSYRTNLRDAAKEGVNFAGHYILTTWGCGTNCSESAVIDARSGKVFFPKVLAGIGIGFCELPDDVEPLVTKADSRLLVLSGYRGGELNSKNSSCGIYYLEWTGTDFKQVGFDKKKRIENP